MQSKRPRFNPLILALALAAVLMVWSVLGGTGSANSSSMEYSTVVHYFESLQVTQFSLDLNTGVIAVGREADLVCMDAPMGSVANTAAEAFECGDIPGISIVLIDGEVKVTKSRNTPPCKRAAKVV